MCIVCNVNASEFFQSFCLFENDKQDKHAHSNMGDLENFKKIEKERGTEHFGLRKRGN